LARLRVLSGRQARRILEQYGFELSRQHGSHMIMFKATDHGGITVPIPDHRELRPGTLRRIIEQSELPRELFESD
jgi:predicted RNA binding protein YcfA (HicA-like mRNA interferase family)